MSSWMHYPKVFFTFNTRICFSVNIWGIEVFVLLWPRVWGFCKWWIITCHHKEIFSLRPCMAFIKLQKNNWRSLLWSCHLEWRTLSIWRFQGSQLLPTVFYLFLWVASLVCRSEQTIWNASPNNMTFVWFTLFWQTGDTKGPTHVNCHGNFAVWFAHKKPVLQLLVTGGAIKTWPWYCHMRCTKERL